MTLKLRTAAFVTVVTLGKVPYMVSKCTERRWVEPFSRMLSDP